MQRLPAPGEAGQPRPQRARTGGGGHNGSGEQGSVRDELRAVQRLALSLDYQVRELGGVVFDTCLIVKAASLPSAMVEAGQTYNTEVSRQKKGHGLGAPFPHIVVAMLEAAQRLDLGEKDNAIVQDTCSECLKGQLNTAEIFGACKAKVTAQGKSEAQGKAVIKLAVKTTAAVPKSQAQGDVWHGVEIRAAVMGALKKEGAVFQVGPAPRADLARVVQQHVG
ncbi:unnamed protein product [Prorocentrum cordatum]|uniref:Uncharacterized protein n=1 Tax=Prorocentrum cordatum TaxID=2364126 RepID=A0ABN9TES5_9DINO|nr:unnamed protein product [Polarella glacialis]